MPEHDSLARFPSLGIIGGMGHVSTIDYYSRIIRLFQTRRAAVRNDDYPRVCIQGIAGADNVETLSDGNLYTQLTEAALLLAESHVQIIGVPCNTVHNLIPSIAEQTGLPFLNMVDATRDRLEAEQSPTFILLATRRTIASNIYGPQRHIDQRMHLNLSSAQQAVIDSLILRVNAGDSIESLILQMDPITRDLPSDVPIALACTELSGFAPYIRSQGRRVVDSLEELVEITYAALSKEQAI